MLVCCVDVSHTKPNPVWGNVGFLFRVDFELDATSKFKYIPCAPITDTLIIMPGLLDTDDDVNFSVHFWIAVTAEFIGSVLFAFLGGAAAPGNAAWANGIALAVLGRALI